MMLLVATYNIFNRNDIKIILYAQTELNTLDFSRNVIDMEGLSLLIPLFEAMSKLRKLTISSSNYYNELNFDVFTHLTLLRLNKSWNHSCLNCTIWIIINNFIIFKF